MKYHVNVYNIDWDIIEEDLEGCCWTVEELKAKLPHHMRFDLYIDEDEYHDDVIADYLFDMVGWEPIHFEYTERKFK